MSRLLLDQGLPRSTVEFLRKEGWDVVHAFESGLSTASDQKILEFARADSRYVCTLDADFHALLAVSGASGPSVIRIRREGLRGPEIAGMLMQVWKAAQDAIKGGALVTVTERTIRVRRLPILRNKAKGASGKP